ncbi:hypothetical protein P280DRAFT_478033 [Massarina eburnea CBS 473.64]|uniref:Uncharacterized protein n=1 Tax=Massarina eburnea CBS 473.64 TaxID=1395130 RepID=A0A6A6S7M6_9PLEO|nr:hypothetical protein P280DRAFT_478033 [Massarina eburnea CBS 473.64]
MLNSSYNSTIPMIFPTNINYTLPESDQVTGQNAFLFFIDCLVYGSVVALMGLALLASLRDAKRADMEADLEGQGFESFVWEFPEDGDPELPPYEPYDTSSFTSASTPPSYEYAFSIPPSTRREQE